MSNSSLVNVKVPAHSNNYTIGRSGRKISVAAYRLSQKVVGFN